MKRASLTIPPAKPKAETADLTDRLLPHEPPPAPKRARPKPAASRPKAKAASPAPRVPQSPLPPPSSSAPSAPGQSVPRAVVDTAVAASVDQALAQCREALAALKVAANDVPARYDTAMRVRLDVLAHHIQQVAEYLEAYTRKSR